MNACFLSCGAHGVNIAPGWPGKKSNATLFCPLLAQCGEASRAQKQAWLLWKGLSSEDYVTP